MIKRPKFLSKPLSTYHPKLLYIAIAFRQLERHIEWLFDKHRYSSKKSKKALEFRIKKHKSVLIRKLGDSDIKLQYNKIENLKIVAKELSGTIIKPNETFSYFKLLGKPTAKRGFKEGMELSHGEVKRGIGGGICQSSNLIYWLVLHSPLTIIERYHHSFDPFPDEGRILPFASGATVMYNYRDLRFKNNTPHDIQLNLWIDDKYLHGELRTNGKLKRTYKVFEKNHMFVKKDLQYYRSNELHRKVIDKHTGNTEKEEFIIKNFAQVKYIPTFSDT